MNSRRHFIGAMFGMVVMATALLFGATAAEAQLIWNPPCKNITFVNNAPCPVTVTLTTVPAGVVPTVVVPGLGGTVGPLPVPPNPPGLTINGVVSSGGFAYPMVIPGPPSPPAPVPSNGWVPSVSLGPGCCVDIYFDLTTCTVYMFPTPVLCRP